MLQIHHLSTSNHWHMYVSTAKCPARNIILVTVTFEDNTNYIRTYSESVHIQTFKYEAVRNLAPPEKTFVVKATLGRVKHK